jgi:hypothetical protein
LLRTGTLELSEVTSNLTPGLYTCHTCATEQHTTQYISCNKRCSASVLLMMHNPAATGNDSSSDGAPHLTAGPQCQHASPAAAIGSDLLLGLPCCTTLPAAGHQLSCKIWQQNTYRWRLGFTEHNGKKYRVEVNRAWHNHHSEPHTDV